MKKRKILLVLVIITILLLATVMAASGKPGVYQVNGGGNYPYGAAGWAWANLNITVDPSTGEADGMFHYKSYTVEQPKDWGGWIGEPICGAYGEYLDYPTLAIVVQIVETVDAPSWVGKYAKFAISDVGQGEDGDLVGLAAWDWVSGPVDEMPSCLFEVPFAAWPIVNGNLTIHIP